ncbi:MAG: hypothetical protein ABIP27_12700 [Flavobacterium circumlabens]|uniref:Uncharacterized protein n=1 Tax=Flavobacterium circumlabens TaxID=2133765 RepID=A0A4Y7UKZ8_9FLAO|nr:hypothetical protein [Flavobacterium circumlabens]TCN61231.1 hypothetical protein EV142_101819 [Flavobacterium circumlabens]TEB46329.1 hypothetical protein D0809_04875 [Flavobacterium circumlabens]
MTPTIKKYFISIIFLVSPVTLSLYAQSTIEKPVFSVTTPCKSTSCTLNQKNDIADVRIGELDNSNQFIAGLSIPKDSLTMATDSDCQTTSKCDESAITGSYSVLAKDIIENYKYDFSETFIDILFFENIDLARKRTI